MKNTILFFLSLICCVFFLQNANSQATAQTLITIEGTVTNVQPGAKVVNLYSYYGLDLDKYESATLDENGRFTFHLDRTLRHGLYAIGFDPENTASIVLSNNETDIIVKADIVDLKNGNIDVKNSLENDVYLVFLNGLEWFADRLDNLNEMKNNISTVDRAFVKKSKDIEDKNRLLILEYNKMLDQLKKSYPDTFVSDVLVSLSIIPQLSDYPELKDDYDNEPAFMHDHFFDHINFDDNRIIYTPFLTKKYFTYLNDYTHHTSKGFKDSVDVMLDISETDREVLEFTVQLLIDTFTESGPEGLVDYVVDSVDNYAGCDAPFSEITAEKIENIKRLRVGQMAPDIVGGDPDGNLVALSSVTGSNNALLIYFWASWCHFCQEETPNLAKIYNNFKDRGFDVYAVALEYDRGEWLSAIENYELDWKNVSDISAWQSESARIYNVRKTPTSYLLNKEGRIIAKDLMADELEIKLNGILN